MSDEEMCTWVYANAPTDYWIEVESTASNCGDSVVLYSYGTEQLTNNTPREMNFVLGVNPSTILYDVVEEEVESPNVEQLAKQFEERLNDFLKKVEHTVREADYDRAMQILK